MFKSTISEPTIFKNIITAISQIIDEVVFRITENGLELTSADRAKVAAIDLKTNSTFFESFKSDGEQKVGVNLTELVKILKRVKKGEKLELEVDDKENRIKISAVGKTTRTFFLPILDISEEELPPIDKLQFTSKVEIETEILEEAVEDADTIADSVVFQTLEDGFLIYAESDSSRVETKLDKTQVKVEGEARARYPIDYIKKFFKASDVSDITVIEFGTDYPMKMTFSSPDVRISLILAPRVEE